MKYKLGDIILVKKNCGLLTFYDELHKKDKFKIIEVDGNDDVLPYLLEFYIEGEKRYWWVDKDDIKKLASAIILGGE